MVFGCCSVEGVKGIGCEIQWKEATWIIGIPFYLNMQAEPLCETLVNICQTTWTHILEDSNLYVTEIER
jgi:hypothetical protein